MSSGKTAEKPADERGTVTCAKCGHTNPGSRLKCETCSSRLWLGCPDCGHRNERQNNKCNRCGRRLHKTWYRRLRRKLLGSDDEVTIFMIVLAVILVIILLGGILWLGESNLPKPE